MRLSHEAKVNKTGFPLFLSASQNSAKLFELRRQQPVKIYTFMLNFMLKVSFCLVGKVRSLSLKESVFDCVISVFVDKHSSA